MALTQPKLFTITIGNAISAPLSSSSDFKTQLEAVGTNELQIAPVTKEIEFKEPETSTEEVKLLGNTSGIQNSELDPQAPTKAEFTATLLLNPEADNDFDLEQFKYTAESTKPSGYTRYNYASATPAAGFCVVVQYNGGTGNPKINWMLNNATIDTLGGMKVNADGYAEQEIKISCAANDAAKEFDADGGT